MQDAENRAEKNWLTRKYHKVHLEEIEIQIPRGFFDYAFENLEVFNLAFHDSVEHFRRHEIGDAEDGEGRLAGRRRDQGNQFRPEVSVGRVARPAKHF